MDSLFYSADMRLESAANKDGKKVYTFIASHAAEDRLHRTIDQAGWQLANYRANPVVTYGHAEVFNPSALPIGQAINVTPTADFLRADIVFNNSPMGREVQELVDSRDLRAMSATWTGIETTLRRDSDQRIVGIHFAKQELVALSIVLIPANPEALRIAQLTKDPPLTPADIRQVFTEVRRDLGI